MRATDTKSNPIPPEDVPHPIYFSFTYGGLVGHLRDYRERHNTRAKKAKQASQLLNVHKEPNGSNGSIYTGVNGQKSFVLCRLVATVANEQDVRELQMQELESLPEGTLVWIRVNKKFPITTQPPAGTIRGFNMVTVESVRDRRKKIGKHFAKEPQHRPMKACGGAYVLCKMID